MTSETAKVWQRRLSRFNELREQLEVLENQIRKADEEIRRPTSYAVCCVRFTRFNVEPNSGSEPVTEVQLSVSTGGAVILDRELLQLLITKLREARDRVEELIKKIPDFEPE